MDFTYTARPGRVLFGRGRLSSLGEELERLGIENAMIVSTADQSELAGDVAATIGRRAGIVYPGAAQHTPTSVTESALQAYRSVSADGIVAIGGGSTIGLSKAVALRNGADQIVVPTTFAGSEMTAILGQTEAGKKTTMVDDAVLPETVIYDPELLFTLPLHIAGPSAMNAIAHAMESLYAEQANPVISMMAEESIRALGAAVPVFMGQGGDVEEAFERGLYGAWLAGTCLGAVGMAIHHKLCHTLGGTFDLNHADIHCLMLPYSAAYNRQAAPGAMDAIARALGGEDGPSALYDLMLTAARHQSLQAFGLTEDDLDRAADLAVQNPYYNPRPVTREGVRELLQAAWEGRRP